MSTMVAEHPNHWVVSTVVGQGRRKKLGRGAVRVGKPNPERLRAEIIRQAKAARVELGVKQPNGGPVV